MISFIVSVYDRPEFLNACLASLNVQDGPYQIIVCGNHKDEGMLIACGLAAMQYDLKVEPTGHMGANNCYESANMMAQKSKGEWLCFPSDDSLYVCKFSEIMLETAAREKADLVYCDCVYRQDKTIGAWPAYQVLNTKAQMGQIDKTCFIVKRDVFEGFPTHPKGWCDGALIEQMVKNGVSMAKAITPDQLRLPEQERQYPVLVVHQ